MKINSPALRLRMVVKIFILLLFVFCGAYKTPVGVVSVSVVILILAVCNIFYYFLSFKNPYFFSWLIASKEHIIYASMLLFLLLISAMRYAFEGLGNDFFISLQLKQVMIVIISTTLFIFLAKQLLDKAFPKEIFISCFLFVVFVFCLNILQLSDEGFRLSYIDKTALDGHWLDFANSSFRGIGLQGLSIWDTSISYSLLFFCGVYTVKYGLRSERLLFVVYTILILFLTVLSGRTGLLFLFIFLTLSLFFMRKIKYLVLIFCAALLMVFYFYLSGNATIVKIIDFSFELILNITKGKLETGSTDDLINNHLFIPNIYNFILGDNIYIGDGDIVKSSIGRSSDSSFVINYAAFGLVGVFVTLFLVRITSRNLFNCFLLPSNKYTSICLSVICFSIVFLLYLKVPIYVSATLLKTLVFTTLSINSMKEHIFYSGKILYGIEK